MIKKLIMENYKSIKMQDIRLNNLSVFIGANGSGKSNIIDALKFLKDSLKNNFDSSLGTRLGWNNVLNKKCRLTEKIKFNMEYLVEDTITEVEIDEKKIKPIKYSYDLTLGSIKNTSKIYLEHLKAEWRMNKTIIYDEFIRKTDNVIFKGDLKEKLFDENKPKRIKIPSFQRNNPFLNSGPFYTFSGMFLADLIKEWKFYNIDVNAARLPSYDESSKTLNEDGSNLAIVLNQLEQPNNKETKKRIINLMTYLVPEFKKWDSVRQMDSSLGFKIHEKNLKGVMLPKMISDGTIRLLSLLVALLHQKDETMLLAIDEPERCLHPQVLKTIVEVMRDVSKKRQIIAATHSRELVKWLKPNEIYLVDKINNATVVKKASDFQNIDEFLEDFHMDELWLSGYLKGGKIL